MGQAEPTSSAGNGRDDLGRFAPGNPGGPGRRKRPDLFALVSQKADEEGVDLAAELWAATKTLIQRAKDDGDVAALKLLFERLTSEDAGEEGMSFEELVRKAIRREA